MKIHPREYIKINNSNKHSQFLNFGIQLYTESQEVKFNTDRGILEELFT